MVKGKRPNKNSSRSIRALEAKIEELEINLAVGSVVLRVESIKRDTAEKALQDCESRYGALVRYVRESSEIIQKMEEELRQALRMEEVGKIMVPALVHDLGNLLAAIQSHAQFSLQNFDSASPVKESIHVIYEGARRADTLLRDFLELFKCMKSDRLDNELIHLNEMVARIWNMVRLEAFSRQVSFSGETEEPLPAVKGDVEKLERVFLNLFKNAIQAVPDGGDITVRTCFLPEDKSVAVSVSNSGPGIPGHLQERIFEPFFTTKEKGTGLGLSICQRIIQQHRGSITLDGSRPGRTTFSVKLPAISQDDHLPSEMPEIGVKTP
jgi:signal transduction histidine kinase